MKNPTSLSLTKKPQSKHDAPRGIQRGYNNKFATEEAEPACCVKYLQKDDFIRKYENKFDFDEQSFYLNFLVPLKTWISLKYFSLKANVEGKQWESYKLS